MATTSASSSGGKASSSSSSTLGQMGGGDLWSELLDSTHSSSHSSEGRSAEAEVHLLILGCGRYMDDVSYKLSPARGGQHDRPVPPGLSYSFFRDVDAEGVKRLYHVWVLESPQFGWLLPRVLRPDNFHNMVLLPCFDLTNPAAMHRTLTSWSDIVDAHLDDLYSEVDTDVKLAMHAKHLEHRGEFVDVDSKDVPQSPFAALPVILVGVERSRLSWSAKASHRMQLTKDADRKCSEFLAAVANRMSAAVVCTRLITGFEILLDYIKLRICGLPWQSEETIKTSPLDNLFLPATHPSIQEAAGKPLETFAPFFEKLMETAPPVFAAYEEASRVEGDVSTPPVQYTVDSMLQRFFESNPSSSGSQSQFQIQDVSQEEGNAILQLGWVLQDAHGEHGLIRNSTEYLGQRPVPPGSVSASTLAGVKEDGGRKVSLPARREGASGVLAGSSAPGGSAVGELNANGESPEEFFSSILQKYPNKRGGKSSSVSSKRSAGGSRS